MSNEKKRSKIAEFLKNRSRLECEVEEGLRKEAQAKASTTLLETGHFMPRGELSVTCRLLGFYWWT